MPRGALSHSYTGLNGSVGSQSHLMKASGKKSRIPAVTVISSLSSASHPCLCKELGSVCVSRSWKQSSPARHGGEGQEHGGAEGLKGADPGVPGVVTWS